MKLYFAAAISGGRARLPAMAEMVAHLKRAGHTVLSEHVAHPRVFELEATYSAEEIFRRDRQWIEESDCLIAEVSTPSLGVGYEIGLALQLGKPVLCVVESGVRLSAMLDGNPATELTIRRYESPDEMIRHIDEFIKANSSA